MFGENPMPVLLASGIQRHCHGERFGTTSRRYQKPLDVAVIGCCVNGPGEAIAAHIGLAGGNPSLIYINGKPDHKINNDQLADEIERVTRGELQHRRVQGDTQPGKKVFPIKQTG